MKVILAYICDLKNITPQMNAKTCPSVATNTLGVQIKPRFLAFALHWRGFTTRFPALRPSGCTYVHSIAPDILVRIKRITNMAIKAPRCLR